MSINHVRLLVVAQLLLACTAGIAAQPVQRTSHSTVVAKEPSAQVPPSFMWEPRWRRPADCGPMSLYVVMRLLGREVSIDHVIKAVAVEDVSGASLQALSDASNELGCPAEVRFVKPAELSSVAFPFIVHFTGSLETQKGHFLPIVGFSPERRQYAIINTDDSSFGWIPVDTVVSQFSGYILLPKQNRPEIGLKEFAVTFLLGALALATVTTSVFRLRKRVAGRPALERPKD